MKLVRRRLCNIVLSLGVIPLVLGGCGGSGSGSSKVCFDLDDDTRGCSEKVGNIVNVSVVSHDENVLKAEYEAGFVQGHLQGSSIRSARDNAWDLAYHTDPSHTFPTNLPVSSSELLVAQEVILKNFNYTLEYLRGTADQGLAKEMLRILYRMLGVYHGAVLDAPVELDFAADRFPELLPAELVLNYDGAELSFLDLYFINAYSDVMDVLDAMVSDLLVDNPSKCSAFVKKTADDVIITHNTWYGYLNQSGALALYVNGDFLSVNTIAPGMVLSNTDFGYNNKGIMFNETTHHATYTEPKSEALWMFMRAALAEQFSASFDQFFHYLSLEPSGTYMNGYMLVNATTKDIALVEMSYKSFVYFKPNGQGGIEVITKPEGISKQYDQEMVQPDYLLGINYPASLAIREDLKAVDNRPARKQQFLAQIGQVQDVEDAKALITYTDPANPLSIYGRWDLGYGETDYPKTVPDGSVDSKVMAASMISYVWTLAGEIDEKLGFPAFWMKYGTARINGEPFIWSRSLWSGQVLRDVPDRQDGEFTLLRSGIR